VYRASSAFGRDGSEGTLWMDDFWIPPLALFFFSIGVETRTNSKSILSAR
jgi:hypothetical protein